MNKYSEQISNDSIFVHDDKVAWREVDGEVLIVPIRMSPHDKTGVYRLNRTASFIWTRLNGERDMRELIALMIVQFEVTQAEAEADTRELLADLMSFDAISKAVSR